MLQKKKYQQHQQKQMLQKKEYQQHQQKLMLQNKKYQQQPELIDVFSEKSALIRGETNSHQVHIWAIVMNVENGLICYYIMMVHLLVRNVEEKLHYHKKPINNLMICFSFVLLLS